MNKKKLVAVFAGINLVIAFLLMLFGQISSFIFFAVAAVTAIVAYRILPRIKN